jgi:hypothetical protein
MTEEKSTKMGKDNLPTNFQNEQLNKSKDSSSDASADGDANNDNKTEDKKDNDTANGGGAEQGNEEGGSRSDPPINGNNEHVQQQKARADTASKQSRLQAAKAAKEASWKEYDLEGTSLVWGNVANRTGKQTEIASVRIGDRDVRVRNPSKKFLALELGLPIIVDTAKIWKGTGGGTILEKFLIIPNLSKMDMITIEAARIKAQCQDYQNGEIFDKIFCHGYYGTSARPNELRGKIIFDPDSEQIAVLVMEKTTGGNWVAAGKIPIRVENILVLGKLRIGSYVSFTTQIRGKKVYAHRILPCAFLDPGGREHNTYTRLPRDTTHLNELTFISRLRCPSEKGLDSSQISLLETSLGKDMEDKMGEERWGKVKQEHKRPVDIVITDNHRNEEETYQGSKVIFLTDALVLFQKRRRLKQTPLCWDLLQILLSAEDIASLEEKYLETGVGISVVVEADEAHQKLILEWANQAILRAVNERDRTKTFIDSIAVTYGFGPLVDHTNFNEILNDRSFQPGATASLQKIKIFDKLVPVEVLFKPLMPEAGLETLKINTDRATRGLVVLTAEAISKNITEEERLEVIPTEVDTIANSLLNSKFKFETHLKFRTTTENLLLFSHVLRKYQIVTFWDNNPPKHFGQKKTISWRTVKFLTTGWTDNMFSELLADISNSEDFFVMKQADIIGKGDKDSTTTFTVISDNHKSGRMLAALKLQFPEMQAMCMNNFITRVAVRGKLDYNSIAAGVHRVNQVFPHSIKNIVFENRTHEFYEVSRPAEQNVSSFQPHFSKYVTALAGFYSVLDEQEVSAFLSLAGVEIQGATLTWFYNTTEQDYVLQIQTDQNALIKQLQEREGGQHDVVTFLKWTQELGSSLKFAGVLGAQNKPRDMGQELNPVKQKKKLLTAKQIAQLSEVAEMTEEKQDAWQVVGKHNNKEKTKAKTADPSKSAVRILTNRFQHLDVVQEVDEKEEEPDSSEEMEDHQESESEDKGNKLKASATQKERSKIITMLARKLYSSKRVDSLGAATLLIQNEEKNLYTLGMTATDVQEELGALAQMEPDALFHRVKPIEDGLSTDMNVDNEGEGASHGRKRKKTAVNTDTEEPSTTVAAEPPPAAMQDSTTGNSTTEDTESPVPGIRAYFATDPRRLVEEKKVTSLIHVPPNNGGGR